MGTCKVPLPASSDSMPPPFCGTRKICLEACREVVDSDDSILCRYLKSHVMLANGYGWRLGQHGESTMLSVLLWSVRLATADLFICLSVYVCVYVCLLLTSVEHPGLGRSNRFH